jgi:hypothetical protein
LRTSILISIEYGLIYFLNKSMCWFYSCILANILLYFFLTDSHSELSEMKSHSNFAFHSPVGRICCHSFIDYFFIFIWKVSAHFICLFILIGIFDLWFLIFEFFILWILISCQMNNWQFFLLFCKHSLHSVVSFAMQKLLNLMQSLLWILAIIS